MKKSGTLRILGSIAAVSTASATAQGAGLVEVIYSEISGHPTAQVPGTAMGNEFTSFDRPYRSPNGSRWVITGDSAGGEVLILGSGTAGSSLVIEGSPSGFGDNWGLTDRNLGVNDAGQFTFVNNTDGPTATDDKTVLYDGANFVIVAQEGDGIPGFTMAEAVMGLSNAIAGITSGGNVYFASPSSVGTLPSSQDDFLLSGSPLTVLLQTGVTIPGNQAGGTMLTWENLDSQDYYVSSDGLHSIIQGDLAGTVDDDVAVVDGNVVIQENQVVPGSGYVDGVVTIVEPAMMTNGDWFVQGNNTGGQDWIVLNGNVIAQGGDPITTGAGENFSDAAFSNLFFVMAGNNYGDYVVGGTTDNPDDLMDAVIVFNGEQVILRQTEPVDLDGNGINDDDVFVNIFNNYDSFLTDDGWYYFTGDLVDGAATALGQGFMRIRVYAPGDTNGDLQVNVDDLVEVIQSWGDCVDCPDQPCPADVFPFPDGDCTVDVNDLNAVIINWS